MNNFAGRLCPTPFEIFSFPGDQLNLDLVLCNAVWNIQIECRALFSDFLAYYFKSSKIKLSIVEDENMEWVMSPLASRFGVHIEMTSSHLNM